MKPLKTGNETVKKKYNPNLQLRKKAEKRKRKRRKGGEAVRKAMKPQNQTGREGGEGYAMFVMMHPTVALQYASVVVYGAVLVYYGRDAKDIL